jgi:hypothetical protein
MTCFHIAYSLCHILGALSYILIENKTYYHSGKYPLRYLGYHYIMDTLLMKPYLVRSSFGPMGGEVKRFRDSEWESGHTATSLMCRKRAIYECIQLPPVCHTECSPELETTMIERNCGGTLFDESPSTETHV